MHRNVSSTVIVRSKSFPPVSPLLTQLTMRVISARSFGPLTIHFPHSIECLYCSHSPLHIRVDLGELLQGWSSQPEVRLQSRTLFSVPEHVRLPSQTCCVVTELELKGTTSKLTAPSNFNCLQITSALLMLQISAQIGSQQSLYKASTCPMPL